MCVATTVLRISTSLHLDREPTARLAGGYRAEPNSMSPESSMIPESRRSQRWIMVRFKSWGARTFLLQSQQLSFPRCAP